MPGAIAVFSRIAWLSSSTDNSSLTIKINSISINGEDMVSRRMVPLFSAGAVNAPYNGVSE
ncbi:hypothetical protein FK545_09370 [Planococcus glaciei]|nr:hypothetical protein [Planococcus glaciei]QDY45564.1 hypothetical protein FK545_09370 [Planococcus glaciei]